MSRSRSTSSPGCPTSSRPIRRCWTKRPLLWTERGSSCWRISPAQSASRHSRGSDHPDPATTAHQGRRHAHATQNARSHRERTSMSPTTQHDRRWLILALIGIAQLMIVLDLTIVNIALPSAQRDLGFSNDARQWIITAYALAFGSLLLLGGKLGDLFGRKWAFIGGLLGFAAASAVGGAAGTFGVLVAARATQGIFAALLAPSALALLAVTFTDEDEREKAFAVFGAVAGGGSAVGLLLGGVLTEWLDWRWCLYVNLLIALPTAIAALRLIQNVEQPARPRLDLLGAALSSSG